jgi:eukaryotic-like serine/threonine-protein kinase
MMTPERWQQVKDVLATVLELSPQERAAYLERSYADDPSLREEIEPLVASGEGLREGFLSESDLVAAAGSLPSEDMPWVGRRVGAYKVVELIGAGGMGEVYRAFRADDQYRKQVALKLIRNGQDSRVVVSRFRNERQILAGLEHPNIARLLEGGTTDSGLPYLVMEFIEGQPINQYCESRKLSTAERLSLFLEVCAAVQYAHQRLIVHRDLKPGNILVTPDGVPKLLDFGIAKILESPNGSDQADPTVTMLRVLTPHYASPEQVRGQPITTASDVYSLGVILYELLTGRSPYGTAGISPEDAIRAVCETEVSKPSTAVRSARNLEGGAAQDSASEHSVSANLRLRLAKQLRGDLDNIVLMALRKEPQRRYSSVERFADDIRRHLHDLPVIARKDTFRYRTSKFVVRQRTAVIAAAIVTAVLIAGILITLREERKAQRRFDDVRNLSNTLLFKIDDSIKDLPGSTEARHLLISSAQQYLDSLSQEASGDASLLRQLADGYQKLGSIQGESREPNLGDSAAAVESLKKAVAIREALVRANPSDRSARQELQQSYETIAYPLLAFKLDEAAEYVEKSVKLSESLYREDPSNPALLQALTLAYQSQAQVLTQRNDLAGATVVQSKSLELAKQLASKLPDRSSQLVLSYGHKKLGGLLIAQKQYPRALFEYNAAQSIDESLLAGNPADPSARYAITFDLSDIGYIEDKEGNYAAALGNYQKVLEMREAFVRADPHDARAMSGIAHTCGYLAGVLRDQKKFRNALRYDQRRLSILDQQASHAAGNRLIREQLAEARWDIGDDYLAIAESESEVAKQMHTARLAQSDLLQAQAGLIDAKEHGLLYGDMVSAPTDIERDLSKCTRLLHASRSAPGKGLASPGNP